MNVGLAFARAAAALCWALLASSLNAAETPLADGYPDDKGIAADPAVLFAEDFESGTLGKWDQARGSARVVTNSPAAGHHCVEMEMARGQNTGGDAIKWFLPGADRVYARFWKEKQTVWFDNVVVATRYIGPLRRR